MAELPDTIVPIREAGTRPPLFCVHPVSGSAYPYLGLAGLLDDDQPVYGFEAPGYDDDQEPATSLGELSRHYVSLLRTHWPGRSVNLLGWSLGGVVAFDMAQRLTAAGVPVPALVVVDAEMPERTPLPSEKAMLLKFMHDLMAISDSSTPELDAIFASVPDDADPVAVFAGIERAGILPEEVDAELLGHRYGIFRTHVAALFDFEVEHPYPGPVTLVKASKTAAEYRWGAVAPDLDEYTIEGDHHSIWTGVGLATLAGIVGLRLR